jgi:cyanophycin synthetase
LLELLPGIHEHHCAKGRRGGFVERLNDGTYFGHIVEHVALELSEAAGIDVNFGKARYAGAPGVYNVIVAYKAEQGMRYLCGRRWNSSKRCSKAKHFRSKKTRRSEAHRCPHGIGAGHACDCRCGDDSQHSMVSHRRKQPRSTRLWKKRTHIQAAMSDRTSAIAV